ncbi:hypothetical protein, partial [Celeribacter litoreus]|uniref:hypothetical protein n=1 Tax=Celeribacter litoreus TaxID=2876714 RepID=UPI001CC9158E
FLHRSGRKKPDRKGDWAEFGTPISAPNTNGSNAQSPELSDVGRCDTRDEAPEYHTSGTLKGGGMRMFG